MGAAGTFAAKPVALGRLVPGLVVLRHYDRGWLRGDVVAGITVSAYLVPQVMAYAEVAGLPAISGLWAAAPGLVLYAVLGSSRQLSVGPESTTALMTAAGVAALATAAGPGRHAEVAATLALAVGVLCVIGWVSRLGFLAELLSKPVLAGYMTGIAVLMIVSQLGKATGIQVKGDSFVQELAYAVTHLSEAHGPTTIIAGIVVVGLLVVARWAPNWPGPLIAMLGAAAAVQLLGLADQGVAVVGAVPQGLPPVEVPTFAHLDLWRLLPAAVGLAVVAYSDNVLTARAFAFKRRQTIDSNQEFIALGAANLGAGLLSGFPISSSGSRTVLADAMGARTQLHSLVSFAVLMATMLWLGPVLGSFPSAALGGVVIFAALRLIDVAELHRIAAFRRSELVLALGTTVSVLVFGVLPGVGAAIALSVLDLLRRIVHPHDGILGYVPNVAGMHDIDDHPDAVQVPGLVVYRYDSPLFFANADDFVRRALGAVAEADKLDPVDWFLLNAEANTEVDLTAVDALDTLRVTLHDKGIQFAMARVKEDMRVSLDAAGFIDKVGKHLIFPTLPTAVVAYAESYERQHGHRPQGLEIPPVPPQPEARGS